ncbi:hypothetical protein GOODEAATRI_016308 [Goodea atripinnis]|uniref:Uncharacterized protein n=1 Tax=Goodea atripinnis TaxID=208336 RepID=A0ABV0MSJ9_9TELE
MAESEWSCRGQSICHDASNGAHGAAAAYLIFLPLLLYPAGGGPCSAYGRSINGAGAAGPHVSVMPHFLPFGVFWCAGRRFLGLLTLGAKKEEKQERLKTASLRPRRALHPIYESSLSRG